MKKLQGHEQYTIAQIELFFQTVGTFLELLAADGLTHREKRAVAIALQVLMYRVQRNIIGDETNGEIPF